MLWAVYVIYNEAEYIGYSIRSIMNLVDGFIIVDGAYQGYPGVADVYGSGDGTLDQIRELVREKPIRFVDGSQGWRSEVEKRTASLEAVPDGDWLLIQDGDWQTCVQRDAEAQIRRTITSPNPHVDGFTGRIIEYYPTPNKVLDITWGNPLLFRKMPGMHYKHNHYTIYDGEGRYFYEHPYGFEALRGFVIFHRHGVRQQKRLDNQLRWFREQQLVMEQASGHESLQCPSCNLEFALSEGSPLRCPRCETLTGWNKVKWEIVSPTQ